MEWNFSVGSALLVLPALGSRPTLSCDLLSVQVLKHSVMVPNELTLMTVFHMFRITCRSQSYSYRRVKGDNLCSCVNKFTSTRVVVAS